MAMIQVQRPALHSTTTAQHSTTHEPSCARSSSAESIRIPGLRVIYVVGIGSPTGEDALRCQESRRAEVEQFGLILTLYKVTAG